MYDTPVTLRNGGACGALLHSHVSTYPSGSKQQQVTCYTHHDNNNEWLFVRPPRELYTLPDARPAGGASEPVLDGAVVMLRHVQTKMHLHSHVVIRTAIFAAPFPFNTALCSACHQGVARGVGVRRRGRPRPERPLARAGC